MEDGQRQCYRLPSVLPLLRENETSLHYTHDMAADHASDWFLKMRRRLVVLPERKDFINQRMQASASLAAASAIQKDLHLVDLAIQADRRVLSTDKKIVRHLRRLGARVRGLPDPSYGCIRLTTTRRPGWPGAHQRETTVASAER